MSGRTRHQMRITTRPISQQGKWPFRAVVHKDIPALAVLMDLSFQGTIDHEGETLAQCEKEIQGTLTGKYGPFMASASFCIVQGEKIASATLLTHWKGKPLLAFSMTAPEFKGQGMAGKLIEQSISALFAIGESELRLAVTEGNTSAQNLYKRLGFETIGME